MAFARPPFRTMLFHTPQPVSFSLSATVGKRTWTRVQVRYPLLLNTKGLRAFCGIHWAPGVLHRVPVLRPACRFLLQYPTGRELEFAIRSRCNYLDSQGSFSLGCYIAYVQGLPIDRDTLCLMFPCSRISVNDPGCPGHKLGLVGTWRTLQVQGERAFVRASLALQTLYPVSSTHSMWYMVLYFLRCYLKCAAAAGQVWWLMAFWH